MQLFYEHVKRYRKLEYYKKWRQNNKEYSKKRYQNNKERMREHSKKWYQNNKEWVRERDKKYRQNNKEHYREYSKKWYQNNPEKKFVCDLKYLKKLAMKYKISVKAYKCALMSWSKLIHKQKYCQVCYSKDGLNAHHLLFKGFYPELSLIPTNGMLLCKTCHKEAHDLNPRPYLPI